MKEIKYKVGDRVSIIRNTAGHGYEVGSVHTIATVMPPDCGAQLQLDDGRGKWANVDDILKHTPVTPKTLKRSDIIKLIMLGQHDGLINGTGSTQQQRRAIKIFEEYKT